VNSESFFESIINLPDKDTPIYLRASDDEFFIRSINALGYFIQVICIESEITIAWSRVARVIK